MLSERDQAIVAEHEQGDFYYEIAERHGVSMQRVGMICQRARQQIDEFELGLLRSIKTGEYPTQLIPSGEGYSTANSYFQWVMHSLRLRGVDFRVITRKADVGTVFQLEPVRETQEQV